MRIRFSLGKNIILRSLTVIMIDLISRGMCWRKKVMCDGCGACLGGRIGPIEWQNT